MLAPKTEPVPKVITESAVAVIEVSLEAWIVPIFAVILPFTVISNELVAAAASKVAVVALPVFTEPLVKPATVNAVIFVPAVTLFAPATATPASPLNPNLEEDNVIVAPLTFVALKVVAVPANASILTFTFSILVIVAAFVPVATTDLRISAASNVKFNVSLSVVEASTILSAVANVPAAPVTKSFFAVVTIVSPAALVVKLPVPLI